MTLKEQEEFFNSWVEEMRSTLFRKGSDYSHEDRLSNFKLAGAICGLTAEQNCLGLIATKVARLGVLLKGKTPQNESVQDSVLDGANYFILLGMLLHDHK